MNRSNGFVDDQAGVANMHESSDEYRALVPIQKGDGRCPLFMVHGAGGHVLNFGDLATGLGEHQTFFGLQARNVNGDPAYSPIEEMAEDYLKAILEVLPNGPYLLGGYSAGGVVAYEMAQRLHQRGKQVELLVFVDTFHPAIRPRNYVLKDHWQRLHEEGLLRFISQRITAKVVRHVEQFWIERRIRYCVRRGRPFPRDLHEILMTRAFYGVADRYEPRPYAGHVLQFRAELLHGTYRHAGPKLWWDDLIPSMTIVEVPGGHDDMVLEPNVNVLSSNLKRQIQAVAAELGPKTQASKS